MAMAGAGDGMAGRRGVSCHADGAVARAVAWDFGDSGSRSLKGADRADGLGRGCGRRAVCDVQALSGHPHPAVLLDA